MNVKSDIKNKHQESFEIREKEQAFLSFLEEKEIYKTNFRFLIIYTKASKEVLYSIFKELLKDVLIIKFEKYTMVIYNNKERVRLNNYIDALCEDFGVTMNVFEGFIVNKENNELFRKFIKIFNEKYSNSYSYATIRELVLEGNLNKDEINVLKQILLDKYLKEAQFEKFIYSLFENNLNISKTAKDVYMHRNTVNNKLTNFENDTTLLLQNFKDAIVVYELLK